ncbi:hypothetical protein D3C87_1264190 [compost metagenome]
MGKAENQRAQHSEKQHGCLHATRTVAVEHDPQRNLRCGESQKVHTGQQAEATGGQVQFPFQIHVDQGVDRAKQIRHKMPEAKWDEYCQKQVQKRVFGFLIGFGARVYVFIAHVAGVSHVEKVVRISQQKRPRSSSSQSSSGHGRISENFT